MVVSKCSYSLIMAAIYVFCIKKQTVENLWTEAYVTSLPTTLVVSTKAI